MLRRACSVGSVVAFAALVAGACTDAASAGDGDGGKADGSGADSPLLAEQAWSPTTRAGMYHISQGSELMPLAWFLALRDADRNVRFVDRLPDFGFLRDNTTAGNPYQLPVGVTEHIDDETAVLYGENHWVGINCAACHTGQVSIRDRFLRIDGAPSLVDIPSFQRALIKAVRKTYDEPARFDRFASEVGADRASLRNRFGTFAASFGNRLGRSDPEYVEDGQVVPSGPGRLDGLGAPANETLCKLADMGSAAMRLRIENPANCATAQPPASLPHLWGVPQQEFVQWAGNVHASLPRNVGEVNGVYGTNWVESKLGVPVMRTSANFEASHTIEQWLGELRSPSWRLLADDGVVPALDEDRVVRGANLFAEHCEGCHAIQPELTEPDAEGYSYWTINITPTNEVGTDARLLDAQLDRTAILPSLFKVPFLAAFGLNSVGPGNVVSANDYRAFLIIGMIKQKMLLDGLFGDEQTLLEDCRDTRGQPEIGYKARSLEGIVFTAPYLHNGSVPTLDDLLRPAAERPTEFYVGCTNYDVDRLGYDCDPRGPRAFLYETRLPSNSNQGHEYGSDLDEEDRAALLEFLKSLEQPENPPRPSGGLCE